MSRVLSQCVTNQVISQVKKKKRVAVFLRAHLCSYVFEIVLVVLSAKSQAAIT